MSGQWIFRFEEIGQGHNDLVGKKCANLGEMAGMGLPVPPGFALTLKAYEDFMDLSGAGREIREYLGKAGSIDTIQRFNEVSADLQKIVDAKDVPSEMGEMFLSYYSELCRKCTKENVAVAVRSAVAGPSAPDRSR